MYKLRYMVERGRPETLSFTHWLLCEANITRLLHVRHRGEAIRLNVQAPTGEVVYSYERK